MSPKDCIFATSSVLNGNDMLQLPSLATLLSLRCEGRFRSQHKQLLKQKKITPRFAASDTVCLSTSSQDVGCLLAGKKTQVAHRGVH